MLARTAIAPLSIRAAGRLFSTFNATAELKALPKWRKVENRDAITRTYEFKDFNEAFAFMTRTALVADKVDHHPEWSNVYNRVNVVFTTHDAAPEKGGALTHKDTDMAKKMDAFYAQFGYKN